MKCATTLSASLNTLIYWLWYLCCCFLHDDSLEELKDGECVYITHYYRNP